MIRNSRRRRRLYQQVPLWFGIPALAIFLFVIIIPSIQGIALSFTDWNGITDDFAFVGLKNFIRIFNDPRATGALQNTLVLAVTVTVVQNVLGLLLALGVNGKVRSRHFLRIIFFTPVVLTPLVAGYIWGYLLSPRGTVNQALEALGFGFLKQTWLGDPRFALASICVAIIWQFAGYSMVIYLAGLQAIPAEVTEAALLDGAGPVRRLVSVTLPLINGAVVITLLLTLIGSLSQFDQVMAMTGGGPGNATQTISTSIYRIGFAAGDYPYGIALAVVMTIFVAAAAALQYRLTLRKVEY
ncbi:MAG: sugar ABC transporter permease [Protaetiibacter sp.]